MSDEAENVPAVTAEVKEKKARKPRKPREPKVEGDDGAGNDDDDKRSANRVEHEGAVITLTGKDVRLQAMTPEQQKEHKVVGIVGVVGKPCATPLGITFKSKQAAAKFFDRNLNTDEPESLEFIVAGGKTNWYSPDLMDMMR